MLRKAGFFILIFSIFCACSDVVQDKEDPILTKAELNAKSFEPGDVLSMVVAGTDNENLGQVRLRVQEAFDKSNFGFWYILDVTDISGTNFESTLSFDVPDSALAGYYEVAVQFSDIRGNGSLDSTQYFTITQEGIAPELSDFQTQPDADQTNTIFLQGGDTLIFSGLAISDTTLSEVDIELVSDLGATIENYSYNLQDSTNFWDFGLYADSIIANFGANNPDVLLVKVTDSTGHLTRESFDIEYSP